MSLNESIVEDAALEWFGELGYAVGHGPHLAPSAGLEWPCLRATPHRQIMDRSGAAWRLDRGGRFQLTQKI